MRCKFYYVESAVKWETLQIFYDYSQNLNPGGGEGGGGGGGTPDFKGQGDQRILLGLKFSIPGFFGVGKFGKYFFGWQDLIGDFFGQLE